jgi:hypothetical protein
MGITLTPQAFGQPLGLLCAPDLTWMIELICRQLPWAVPCVDHDLGSSALELLCAVWCARPWRCRPLLAWNVVQLPHLCLHASVSTRAVVKQSIILINILSVVHCPFFFFFQTTKFWKQVLIPWFEGNCAKEPSPVGFLILFCYLKKETPSFWNVALSKTGMWIVSKLISSVW